MSLSEPAKKAIKGLVGEVSASMTRMEGERDLIKEAIKKIADDHDVDKKILHIKCARHIISNDSIQKNRTTNSSRQCMQKLLTSQMTSETVSEELEQTACSVANDIATSLNETADLLEQIAPGQYGLLITSLRWHATRTISNEFLNEYKQWVKKEILDERT